MKILVGIIHSNEPQVKDCINSVKNQNFHDFHDYFIISGLTKSEAHDKLYSKFMDSKDDFDIFIKLDGDMIIERIDFFSFIENHFTNDENLDWIRIEVFDYFLRENLSGLNIYSKNVKWNLNSNNYFTDRTMIRESVRKDKGIAPSIKWISHCKNATLYQAFNFGFHRAIKAFQFNINQKVFSTLQWVAFLRIYKLIKTDFSKINLIIIAALVYVIQNKINDIAINEKNIEKVKAFSFLSEMTKEELLVYIENSSILNFFKLRKLGFLILFYKLNKLK